MEGKKTFIAYCDWLDLIEDLDDDEAGKIIKWLLNYVNDKEPTPPSEKHLKMVCKIMKSQLKEDLEKWKETIEAKKEAGRKGGLAKSSNTKQNLAQPSTTKQDLANQAVYDNDNVNDNDNVIYGNKLPVYNNVREEEQIENLKQLIHLIEEMFNRCLTNAETITIQEFSKTMSNESIIRDLKTYSDKTNPIAYMKKMIENARVKNQVERKSEWGKEFKESFKEEQKTYEINCWLDAFNIYYDEEAPQYMKDKAKEYMDKSKRGD